MSPFIDIVVQPSYGENRCLVRWVVLDDYRLGEFTVFRSYDGTSWTPLNADNPVIDGSGVFEDSDVLLDQRFEKVRYRIYLHTQAKEDFDSPIVGPYEKLNRREYGIARRIMQLELRNMAQGRNGIPVIILKPRRRGKPCECVDPVTGQGTQTTVCRKCFGTGFEGGYTAPLRSWVTVVQRSPIDPQDAEGASVDTIGAMFRTLAYPPLQKDDVLVHPSQDDRYVVGKVESFEFKGVIPVVYHVTVEQLARRDIRYKIPVA